MLYEPVPVSGKTPGLIPRDLTREGCTSMKLRESEHLGSANAAFSEINAGEGGVADSPPCHQPVL